MNQGNLRLKAQRRTCCDEHESKDFTVSENREQRTERMGKRQAGRQTRADLALLALRIVCLSVLCQCHNDADSHISNISSSVYCMDIIFGILAKREF